MSSGQKLIMKKLSEIDKSLPQGVSLTFALDNMVELMNEDEKKELLEGIKSLIEDRYLAKHTNKATKNNIPFWLEFTKLGREYCESIN
jgi:hypothetical protein